MRDESKEESLDAVRFISKICRSSTVFTTAGFLLRFIGDSYYMFYNFFFIGLLLLLNKRFCCVPACRFLTNLLFDAVVLFHFVFGHDHSCIRKWCCVSKLFLSFVKAYRLCSCAMLFRVFSSCFMLKCFWCECLFFSHLAVVAVVSRCFNSFLHLEMRLQIVYCGLCTVCLWLCVCVCLCVRCTWRGLCFL